MRCEVLLFAQLAEAAGEAELMVDLPDGASVADALEALSQEHESIAALRNRIAVAVDEAYVRAGTILEDGCTLVLIPPVSGG
ncbi:MAG: molybdopterin converting factor subunit 1 [Phycisphaerales bacterium]|nr:MAG: molybdopterin converting factor subunit 1 [Phycisphaerales bacterium]